MKEEKRISYRAGITRVPSDILAGEGDLAECINLVGDHEELKVVQDPVRKFSTSHALVFVHQMQSGTKNYILYDDGMAELYYRSEGGGAEVFIGRLDEQVLNGVESVGNTLVVSTPSGMQYFLWKGGGYVSLGSKIPDPDVRFRLYHSGSVSDTGKKVTDYIGVLIEDGVARLEPADQEVYNNYVTGTYAMLKKKAREACKFTRAFLLRYAVELYDGTLTLHSSPIAVFPSFGKNLLLKVENNIMRFSMETFKLTYFNHTDYSAWSDIVKKIVVYATDEIENYNLSGDVGFSVVADGATYDYCHGVWGYIRGTGDLSCRERTLTEANDTGHTIDTLSSREESDLLDDLRDSSVFYRLCDIPQTRSTVELYLPLNQVAMTNLTTQEQMTDEYYSHCEMIPKFMKAYNGRLNLASVSRSFFHGFGFFSVDEVSGGSGDTVYVEIDTKEGTKVVSRELNTSNRIWSYFYYPDPRAKKAVIMGPNGTYTITLAEHSGLNGAVGVNSPFSSIVYGGSVPSGGSSAEVLNNQLFTSEANNPFVFKTEGNNTIGTGEIIGMATQTVALSQGQFGQYPLLVFASDGIWAMSLDGTGVYQSVHPLSREVCMSGKSITETDGAVYFVSKKGLMVIVGSSVKCVSEQMDGRSVVMDDYDIVGDWEDMVEHCQGGEFLPFIRSGMTRIAYDYIGSRLLIVNAGYDFAYCFGMKDSMMSKVLLPCRITDVVKSYPDYLLVGAGNTHDIYSLYDVESEVLSETRKMGFLLTRPLKLGGLLTVSSLRELVNVGVWDDARGSVVKTEVWLSDDLKDWFSISSRFGVAARYMRIGLYVRLLPSERLSGTIIREQERRINNLRSR